MANSNPESFTDTPVRSERYYLVEAQGMVPATVEVSGRRFVQRPLRSILAMRLFPLLYRLGVPSHLLAQLYGAPR